MGDKSLVIVESPTKARTITKFLGNKYVVKASNGHIRDLPNNASEIPLKLKKEPWARLGVNIENDFEALYVIPKSKKDHVKLLKDALAGASEIFLATDEDREGESISWHLMEVLNPKVPIKRLVFHEITKEAIENALKTARAIDENLVKAQETRRIVDRLFGYSVSPLLWKKMAPGLSAGRVQSVAVRLLVEREHERIKFKKASYWGIKSTFAKGSDSFDAELTHVGDDRVAIGKDFDDATGAMIKKDGVVALGSADAEKLKQKIEKGTAAVTAVEEKPYTTRPSPPFVTSTLQQEGSRKLRFSAKYTMTVAQQLYENGFITYMRTDSTTLSDEALNAARHFIKKDYGEEFLPESARIYKTKVKNAQEAHEAIRPAGEAFTLPEVVKEKLGNDPFRLYDLIWKRTVASQMNDAKGTHIAAYIHVDNLRFRAAGKTITFPGFLRAYVEGSDDPDAELADQEKILPKMATGDSLAIQKVDAAEHSTQPPARFTEGSLIKELERLGIGRPSTWATIVELVLSRQYAFKKGTALVPSFVAIAVVGLLKNHFMNLLDYEFTARLEDDLDGIARGEAGNIDYLKKFYYGNGHPGLKKLVELGEEKIDPREVCGVPIGKTAAGIDIEVRIGRYGPFITNGTNRASVPSNTPPDELTLESATAVLENAARPPESLGEHPDTGLPIYLKVGPYGPYVQHGDPQEDEKGKKIKPPMASLLKNITPEEVKLDYALKLLALPRTVGANPENNEPILAANGRYGPYIKCGSETRSINLEEFSPLDITIPQALELLSRPKGRGRTSKPKVLKELGKNPANNAEISLRSGRYGPYVTDGEVNATLARGSDPETVTLEDAIDLIQRKLEKLIDGGNAPKKKKGAKKKAASSTKKTPKKASTKKSPAKKKKVEAEVEAQEG